MLLSAAFLTGCSFKNKKPNHKTKVILIGLDGANWPTIDPLIREGKLPFFKQLKKESAWASFKTFKPAKSSVIWTSIATGKKMEKHGILDFNFYNKNKQPIPYSNAEKREPSIWQILNQYQKKSIVINWFVSHPPDKIDGIVVSDHYKRLLFTNPERIDEYGNTVHQSIYFKKFNQWINRDFQDVLAKTGLPDFQKIYSQAHPGENMANLPLTLRGYNTFVLQDHLVTNITNNLLRTKDFDFFATYIRMPDIVQHFALRMIDKKYMEEVLLQVDAGTATQNTIDEAILKISHLLEPIYKFSENLLKQIMSYKKYQDAYFIVVSDHGFSLYPGGYNHYDLPDRFPAPDGIMMMKGPGIKPGFYKNANIYDIAPTILSLYDLPIGKNMDGRVLNETLKFTRKVRFNTYNLKRIMKRDHLSDKDALKELRTLGYIEEEK